MSQPSEPTPAGTPDPGRSPGTRITDLVAFLGVLLFAAALALLAFGAGPVSPRVAFAGAAGLVAACIAAWRRLRRNELRRWRAGHAAYLGRRLKVVTTWGVEGMSPPSVEPPAVEGAPPALPPPSTPPAGNLSPARPGGQV